MIAANPAHEARTFDITELAWPLSRLGEALDELARRAGLSPASKDAVSVPRPLTGDGAEDLGRWVEWAADRLGVEAEPVATPYPHFHELLLDAGPAVLEMSGEARAFLVIVRSRGLTVHVIAPDLSLRRCRAERSTARDTKRRTRPRSSVCSTLRPSHAAGVLAFARRSCASASQIARSAAVPLPR